MPEDGIQLLKHDDILTFDEITGFTRVAVNYGIKKVRITGGEPLVRKGIVTLVEMIDEINGIDDLSMTTNGILLPGFAKDLFRAGLNRINISLDTVDPERFASITRTGDLNDVIRGIKAAKDAGFYPIKINCVVQESGSENDAKAVASFCKENNLEIRYIRQMDLVSGNFNRVEGGSGGDCSICNRLRLNSVGKLKPCLFNEAEFDIRELGYKKALESAVGLKPAQGSSNFKDNFYNIGG